MQRLRARLVSWLLGDRLDLLLGRLEVQEQFAIDTVVVVKLLLETQGLEVREEAEPDPTFELPKPPQIRVLRLYQRK